MWIVRENILKCELSALQRVLYVNCRRPPLIILYYIILYYTMWIVRENILKCEPSALQRVLYLQATALNYIILYYIILYYIVLYYILCESFGRTSSSASRRPCCASFTCRRPSFYDIIWSALYIFYLMSRSGEHPATTPLSCFIVYIILMNRWGKHPKAAAAHSCVRSAVPSVRTTFIIHLQNKISIIILFWARATAAHSRALCGSCAFCGAAALWRRGAPSAAPERSRRRARQTERYTFAQCIQMCHTNGKFSSEPLLPFGPADGAEPAAV